MRKLHLVGLTTDRDGLIFTARKGSTSGGYIVPLDDKVLDALAEAESVRNGADPRPDGREVDRRSRSDSALTPREMQARLRAGRSIAEVAAEAGVDNEWVARFAVPILAEQAQVVELARGLTYAKSRLGESTQPLGASVVQNLSDKGVFLPDDLADAAWSAFQLHDAVWMVRFRYRSRGRDQEAHWELDVPTARLVARNRHASDLGYVDAYRRRRPLGADDDDAFEDPAPPPSRPSTRAPKATRLANAPQPAKRTTATSSGGKIRGAAPLSTPPVVARTATARGAARAAAGTPPVTTGSSVKAARAVKVKPGAAVKAPSAVKGRAGRAPTAVKGRTAKVPATAKAGAAAGAAKAATGKTTSRRRPARAGATSEGGPGAHTGGVRLAVARVSTERLAASMATAERAPWVAAVRNRPGARPSPEPSPRAASTRGDDGQANGATSGTGTGREVPAFQSRPLPDGGQFDSPRARRAPPAPRAQVVNGGPPPVILPPPRAPAEEEATPLPAGRTKRQRLRSR